MAGLVHRAEQSRERIDRIEARGHPNVAGHALRERMLALIEPAAVERKAERFQHLERELTLARRAELAGERNGRAIRLHLDGLIDEPGKLARQRLEDGVDIRGRDTRRERIDQRVVGGEPARLTQERGLVAHQLDHLFEVGRENLEIARLARLDPEHLGARRRLRQARDQGGRRRDGMVALATHLAQVGERPILELRGSGLGALQEPRHLGCGQQGVVLGLEGRQLLPAHVGAASGHHDGGVPAQQRQRAAERVQAMKFLLQLFVG